MDEFHKFIEATKNLGKILSKSMLFWTILFAVVELIMWNTVPFFTAGKIFVTIILAFIYGCIGANVLPPYGNNWSGIFIAIAVISLMAFLVETMLMIDANAPNLNPTYTVKTIEYYKPVKIERTNEQLVLLGKDHTVMTDSLRLYTNKNVYICKVEYYTAFASRANDVWTVCAKD